MSTKRLRTLPSVTELLKDEAIDSLVGRLGHQTVVNGLRDYLDEVRRSMLEGLDRATASDPSRIVADAARRIEQRDRPKLRPVINATGILLHTGLGRAPLAEAAIDAMVAVARDYASVEISLANGKRSQRVEAVESLLGELTGAEAVAVVNNNAGATMLTLAALAAGKEVIVSRGELIEIGGSFRLPDVMGASGATLREVGTTNKTRIDDYRQAVNEHTAALMRVHTSNFAVVGFTAAASLAELVALGRETGLPVIDDIGSGALTDFARFGFHHEPIAADSIRQGADVALFSGDKLLGGPQCGVIAGSARWVAPIAKHPMMRALRVDKLTLAALAATLRLHRDVQTAQQDVPLLAMLAVDAEQLRRRAERIAARLSDLPGVGSATAIDDVGYLGGGSIPTQQLPTACVAIEPNRSSLDALAARLRDGEPAIMGRLSQDRLLLDLRSVPERHDDSLIDGVRAAVDADDGD